MRRVVPLLLIAAACGDDRRPSAGAIPMRRPDDQPHVVAATSIDAAVATMSAPARADLPADDPLAAAFGPLPLPGAPVAIPGLADPLAAILAAHADDPFEVWPRATALPFTAGDPAQARPVSLAELGSSPGPVGTLRGLPPRASRTEVLARASLAPLDARRPPQGGEVGLDSGLVNLGMAASFEDDELLLVAYVLRAADATTLRAAWPGGTVDPDDADGGLRWPTANGWDAALFAYPELGLAELRLLPVVPAARVVGAGPDGLAVPVPMIGRPIAALVPTLRKLGIELAPDDTDMVESDDDVPNVDHVATFGATDFCAGESTLTAHVSARGVVTGLSLELCYDDDDSGDKRGALFAHLVESWGPAQPAVDDDGDIVPSFTFRGRRMLAYDEDAWTIDIDPAPRGR